MSTQPRQGCYGSRERRLIRLLCAGLLGCTGLSGCTWGGFINPTAPPPPVESLVLRGDSLVEEKPPEAGSPEEKLLGAHEYFRRGDYGRAGDLYHSLREKKRFPERVIIEATFYEAECLRLQSRYPKAADTYTALLKLAPNNPFKEQAVQHMFEIANYWLEDTRVAMKKSREKREKKSWVPSVDLDLVHFEKTKPFLDQEGRAIEKLEQVHYHDITGTLGLGDKALFLAGAVKFYNEDYKEADHFLTMIHESYPNSPLASQAVELAIIAKTMSTGGADYDGRKVAEARVLIDSALRNYPELAAKKDEFLSSKLVGITAQQAEKDYRMAEYWRRTKHPASAWWYYKMIQRRYPGTEQAQKAEMRLGEIRASLEKEGKPLPEDMPQETPTAPKEDEAPQPRRVPAEIGPPPGPLPPSFEPGRPLR